MTSIKSNIDKIVKSEFFKFLLIGAFCTLQNIFWLYFLTTILKIHYLISTIILMFTVNTLGFYLNRRYTFSSRERNDNIFLKELIKYHGIMISSSLFILILMYILVDVLKIWYLSANIAITVGMTIYNFLMHKKWTFK